MTDTRMSRGKVLTGPSYYDMLVGAMEYLRQNRDEVNRLNVYPVPDGDTGTNMLLTLESAINRMSDPAASLGTLVSQSSVGSLMGARGNSGVILSQLFRGMAAGLEDAAAADAQTLTRACKSGVRAAYSAVMRPVEGTILTVAREAADAADAVARDGGDLVQVLTRALHTARSTLDRTPEMLDVLREAGVVDAGGQGLVHIFEGALAALGGPLPRTMPSAVGASAVLREQPPVVLDYPHDLVFLLETEDPLASAADTWDGFGDSLVVVREGSMVKVHIHTDRPLDVLGLAADMGVLMEVEMHNMSAQVAEARAREAEDRPALDVPGGFIGDTGALAVLPIAMGSGVTQVFESLGAADVIRGGATMNPSTEDILHAIESTGAARAVLLPNNSNLILACEQARDMTDVPVDVLPTVSIAQGLAAALAATAPRVSISATIAAMREAIQRVRSIEVTYAVDDRAFGGMQLQRGDVIGFVDGELSAVGTSPSDVLLEILRSVVRPANDRLAVFIGRDVNADGLEAVGRALSQEMPDLEVDFLPGGQEHYYFVAAVNP